MKNNLSIPNDFKVMSIDKDWLDNHKNLCTLIYFDSNKHSPKEMNMWAKTIKEFIGSITVMMLPNDFSELHYLNTVQIIEAKQYLDDALARIKGDE